MKTHEIVLTKLSAQMDDRELTDMATCVPIAAVPFTIRFTALSRGSQANGARPWRRKSRQERDSTIRVPYFLPDAERPSRFLGEYAIPRRILLA